MTHDKGVRLPPVLVVELANDFGPIADLQDGDVLIEGADPADLAEVGASEVTPTAAPSTTGASTEGPPRDAQAAVDSGDEGGAAA